MSLRGIFGFLGGKEPGASAVPDEVKKPVGLQAAESAKEQLNKQLEAIGNIVLEIYRQQNRRDMGMEQGQPDGTTVAIANREAQPNFDIVGKVKLDEMRDVPGRYLVSFGTTHLSGPTDARQWRSSYGFDIRSEGLNEIYPAREEHFVFGQKGGKYEVAGNYKQLYDAAEGKLNESLEKDGWTDIGEAWLTDLNRFV